MTARKTISVIIPAYNEESNVPLLRERLDGLFDEQSEFDFELILVDDHSSDQTPERVKQWADADKRVRLVRLSRNCGSHTAIYAGLTQCRGDAAVVLAADLQDPPELVGEMLARWRQGDDIVWATRAAREGEKMSITLTSRLYHFIFTHIALPEAPAGGTDFFLLDRRIIDECLRIPEKNTDLMFLVQWMGFRQSMISYVKRGRASGKSKWTLGKKLKLAVDAIVSFSFTPIRAMSLLGLVFAVTGFMLAVAVVIGRLTGRVVANTGYAALTTLLLVGFGLIMLMLGIIGEYLWRTFDEARGRPRFLIEERYPNHGATS